MRCYLSHRQKKYDKCLQQYITAMNKLVRERVFGWLNENMAQFAYSNHFSRLQEFKELVEGKIQSLMKINPDLTRHLISRFWENDERRIVKKLDEFPEL